jgi:hypothetical protein
MAEYSVTFARSARKELEKLPSSVATDNRADRSLAHQPATSALG